MATRPVFVPDHWGTVREVTVDFEWHPGLSAIQKRKSVEALHQAAAKLEIQPILEVSTKSEQPIGRSLSSLNLEVSLPGLGKLPVECAFQGSKVFEGGGPLLDLYHADAVAAKRDSRLRESGALLKFDLRGESWPLEPKNAFYDWLYLQALVQNESLSSKLEDYAGFTDIEFNPTKSFSTQARSCALFVALTNRGIDTAKLLTSKSHFLEQLRQVYKSNSRAQPSLF